MSVDRILHLAYRGSWTELLAELNRRADLVNAPSHTRAYTPLHQAAWHGAPLDVVGKLLHLGADRSLQTRGKMQTAQEVALKKHPDRADLHFIR